MSVTKANGNGYHENGDLLVKTAEHTHEHTDLVLVDPKDVIEESVRQILIGVGEDPDRDGLLRTPHRVAKMYDELLEGYDKDLETVINGALFEVEYGEGEMVVVADIEYQSMCEHHMLPFVGRVHVAYIPRDKVVGLSKIPRIVDMFARRLQIQERMTNEIADAIEEALDPVGVIVVVEGQHSCAALRGVKKHGVNMVTAAKRGEFRTNRDMRDEFYRMIGK
jgi:GTP cyclohydrolase I